MNEEFELESRLKKADPATGSERLPDSVVFSAIQSKSRTRSFSYKNVRLGVGSASAGAFALIAALVLPGALAPAPLFSLASGGGATNLAAPAGDAAESKIAGGYWTGWTEYNYVADGLNSDGGRGKVYKAELLGNPNDLMTKLATIFDVPGEVKQDEWSTEEYPSYSIAGDDYSLNLYWSGTGSWSYSRWDQTAWECTGPAVDPATEASSDTSISSDENLDAREPVCSGPTPTPELIPTKAEMTSQLNTILGKLETSLDTSLMTSYRDDWGSSLNIPYVIEGMELPISFYIGWDMRGELSYVSGNSFELKEAGEFNTISAEDAVSRIADWRWSGSAPNSLYNSMSDLRAATSEVMVDPAVTEEGIAPGESFPSDSVPTEPTVVDLIVNRAETAMLGVWDASGGFWLVPGYILYNDQGWFSPIINLIEGVITLPEPMEVGVPMIEDLPATKEG